MAEQDDRECEHRPKADFEKVENVGRCHRVFVNDCHVAMVNGASYPPGFFEFGSGEFLRNHFSQAETIAPLISPFFSFSSIVAPQ